MMRFKKLHLKYDTLYDFSSKNLIFQKNFASESCSLKMHKNWIIRPFDVGNSVLT